MKVSYPKVGRVRWKDGRSSDQAPTPVDNIVRLPVITAQSTDPDRVLCGALDHLHDVVIVGFDRNDRFYFASSASDSGFIIWLLEKGKSELFRMERRMTEEESS